MRLLIVEDDKMLGASMAHAMERSGYVVNWVTEAEDGAASAQSQAYDAIILDLGLPNADGVDLLRKLRARGDATPVVIVTAQDMLARKVEALDAGADDYVVKPFDLDELLARVRVQVRRKDGRSSNVIEAGDVKVDLSARVVTKADAPVQLTAKEFKVLAELLRRMGRFVSKSELEAEIYDGESGAESNTVEVTIYALRRKLGADLILTARGMGYMIGRGGR